MITRKWCEIEYQLSDAGQHSRKSHYGFSIGTKISDHERPSGHHYTLLHTIWQLLEPTAGPILSAIGMSPRQSSFWQCMVCGELHAPSLW